MLDSFSPSMPVRVLYVLNVQPFYNMVQFSDPASITVDAILQHAWTVATGAASEPSKLSLRWITNDNAAFCPQQPDSDLLARLHEARQWYFAGGHHLASIPISTDVTLQEKLRDSVICPAVRLYVVAPPQGAPPGGRSKVEEGREAYRLILKQAHLGKDSSTIDPDPCLAARDFRVHTEAQQRAPMYDGRLPLADNLGPGAALYHPAFAKMWHTLSSDQNLSQVRVDADMEDSVWELRRALCRMDVRDEEESLDTLKKHFSRLFPGTTFHKKYSVLRDGKLVAALDFAVTCSTPYGVEAVIVAGASGPTQALYGYRRASLAEGNLPIFMSSICPCLIIGVDGPLVQIDAAYLTDFVYSDPMGLVSLLFISGTTASSNMRLVRRLQVVRNTVQMLAQSYAENHTGAYRGSGYLLPAPCVAPETGAAWTPWASVEGFSLTFTDPCITLHNRAIFKGEIVHATTSLPPHQHAPASPSRVPVYIKFVPKYGEEVHNLLFQHGLAPELRWCGEVIGGPMMVIMDEVAGNNIQDALANNEPVTEADVAGVDRALSVLGDTFVHGDLRPSTVILKPTPDGAKEAYIIDFKWAGKSGEARYPYGFIENAPEELRGKLITRQHDEDMRSLLLPSSRKRSQPDSAPDPDPDQERSVVRRRVEQEAVYDKA